MPRAKGTKNGQGKTSPKKVIPIPKTEQKTDVPRGTNPEIIIGDTSNGKSDFLNKASGAEKSLTDIKFSAVLYDIEDHGDRLKNLEKNQIDGDEIKSYFERQAQDIQDQVNEQLSKAPEKGRGLRIACIVLDCTMILLLAYFLFKAYKNGEAHETI